MHSSGQSHFFSKVIDHKYQSSNPDAPVVILYAEFGKAEFRVLHQVMLTKVNEGLATYVLRHYLAVSACLTSMSHNDTACF